MTDTDDRPPAWVQAEAGAEAWVAVVRHQRRAPVDHADVYAMAGDMVATLRALDDLARVLAGQLAGYGAGRVLYDDSRTVDPAVRLAEAVEHLHALGTHLRPAAERLNAFWSAIGHIGIHDDPADASDDGAGDLR